MHKKISTGIVIVILLGVAFYGGTLYSKKTVSQRGTFSATFNGQGRAAGANAGFQARGMAGFVAGSVLNKDATSMTVKMQDGSTRIILFSTTTSITKNAAGIIDDITNGSNVIINGTTNSDGSVSAESIQMRPEGMRIGGGQKQIQ